MSIPNPAFAARLFAVEATTRTALLAERNAAGHWTGELSTSALSTATAVMSLEQVRRDRERRGLDPDERLPGLIAGGLRWLSANQNADAGWGDTVKSLSNISTTMLCHASLVAAGNGQFRDAEWRAAEFIKTAGGVTALVARYGKDKTFSVPILTHCALAGLIGWRTITPLPFELACLPAKFYAALRFPVVSYALPALIAIGQVRHHHAPTRNPVTRLLRDRAVGPSLRVLERIQPPNGGFLEATPLTSFVTMSLAGMGRGDHPVAVKGVEFIINSVLPDGSWPIDTNLATWVTTLAVNALGDDLPEPDRGCIRNWLLNQQYRQVHPYTNAAPGGWAWTNLPGGVPDADDTPGAILALHTLASRGREPAGQVVTRGDQEELYAQGRDPRADAPGSPSDSDAFKSAIRWLCGLQNRDGGFPTFCRGWGTLPFDRSSADITAHALRAFLIWYFKDTPVSRRFQFLEDAVDPRVFSDPDLNLSRDENRLANDVEIAILQGIAFLRRAQRPDGSWLPLWFGNQHAPDDINPVYGTAKVLAAFRDAGLRNDSATRRGVQFLTGCQNDDGGWGGVKGVPSSVEETALATEILCELAPQAAETWRGVEWLIAAAECGSFREPSPIGFYFAKLWYFERLYPVIFTVAALRAAGRRLRESAASGHDGAPPTNQTPPAEPDRHPAA